MRLTGRSARAIAGRRLPMGCALLAMFAPAVAGQASAVAPVTHGALAPVDKEGLERIRTAGAELTYLSSDATPSGAAFKDRAARPDEQAAGVEGRIYAVTPPGQARSVQVSLPMSGAAASGKRGAEPRVYRREPAGTWALAGAQQVLDRRKATVTASVSAPGEYAVFDISNWNKMWSSKARAGLSGAVPVDVVLAVDTSGSMNKNDRESLRKYAASSFTDALGPSDRGAVVTFSKQSAVSAPLTSERGDLKRAIIRAKSRGGSPTNIGLGVQASLSILKKQSNTARGKMVVLLTDGQGPYDKHLTARAKAEGVPIYVVALGAKPNMQLLKSIATGTDADIAQLRRPQDLPVVVRRAVAPQQPPPQQEDPAPAVEDCRQPHFTGIVMKSRTLSTVSAESFDKDSNEVVESSPVRLLEDPTADQDTLITALFCKNPSNRWYIHPAPEAIDVTPSFRLTSLDVNGNPIADDLNEGSAMLLNSVESNRDTGQITVNARAAVCLKGETWITRYGKAVGFLSDFVPIPGKKLIHKGGKKVALWVFNESIDKKIEDDSKVVCANLGDVTMVGQPDESGVVRLVPDRSTPGSRAPLVGGVRETSSIRDWGYLEDTVSSITGVWGGAAAVEAGCWEGVLECRLRNHTAIQYQFSDADNAEPLQWPFEPEQVSIEVELNDKSSFQDGETYATRYVIRSGGPHSFKDVKIHSSLYGDFDCLPDLTDWEVTPGLGANDWIREGVTLVCQGPKRVATKEDFARGWIEDRGHITATGSGGDGPLSFKIAPAHYKTRISAWVADIAPGP